MIRIIVISTGLGLFLLVSLWRALRIDRDASKRATKLKDTGLLH